MAGIAAPPMLAHPLAAPSGVPVETAQPPVDLPRSARRVFDALRDEGPLTHRQLVAATGLPARTVRYAVGRLREREIVRGRVNLADCRQTYFYVAPTGLRDGTRVRYAFL